MNVFISHKQEDANLAGRVAAVIKHHDHAVYLDVIDQAIAKNGDDLASYLRSKLGECNCLLAVISESTKTSWWVPWEIGVATEKDYPLSTYLSEGASTPEYLNKWPVLRNFQDLTLFTKSASQLENNIAVQRGLKKSLTESAIRRVTVPDFHRNLKRALGQIP